MNNESMEALGLPSRYVADASSEPASCERNSATMNWQQLLTESKPAPVSHEEMFASLYGELRRIAARELRRRRGVTISETTLLHEAFFKVQQRDDLQFPDQARFLAYAARAMRTLIIDYVRKRDAQKRGAGVEITSLTNAVPEEAVDSRELERLGDAIDELAQLAPELAQLVDLKFFCGYSLIEIAAMRGVSERTAQRDWDKARVLLKRVLEGRDMLASA
jgi:RNA polymerase sigma factor (TIGR02999 family)